MVSSLTQQGEALLKDLEGGKKQKPPWPQRQEAGQQLPESSLQTVPSSSSSMCPFPQNLLPTVMSLEATQGCGDGTGNIHVPLSVKGQGEDRTECPYRMRMTSPERSGGASSAEKKDSVQNEISA